MTQKNGNSGEFDFPKQLGKFRILKHIASGEVSEIFLAKMPGMAGFEREVALKLFHPHLAQDSNFAKAIVEEARIAVILRHPNIVQVYNLEEQGELKYFVMEYIPGLSLSVVQNIEAEKGSRISIPMILYVLLEVLEGLAYAHEFVDQEGRRLNVVHGDLSAKNIMVTDDGGVKIINFGIARAAAAVDQIAPSTAALPQPQERSEPWADVYSLGALLWEAITQTPLEEGARQGASKDWPPLASKIRPDVPRGLDRILKQALALDQGRRFGSAREFKDALKKFVVPVGMDRLRSSMTARVASLVDASAVTQTQGQESSRDILTQELLSRRSASRIWLWVSLGALFVVAVLVLTSLWTKDGSYVPSKSEDRSALDASVASVSTTQSGVDAGTKIEHSPKPDLADSADGGVALRPLADSHSESTDGGTLPPEKKVTKAGKVALKQKRIQRKPPAPIRLTRKDIAKVLRRHRASFQDCAMDYFEKEGSSKELELIMEFTIGSTGRIKVTKLVPAKHESTTLGRCLLKQVERLKFPRHRDKSVSISFPLKFQAVTE